MNAPAAAPVRFIQPAARHRRRRLTNGLMLGLTGLLAALTLLPLVWISLHVLQTGGQYLTLDLVTQMPAALGRSGGGVLPAIQGTLIVTALATLFAVPVGVLAAVYVAQHPNTPLGLAVRFGTDVLAGVPSIVIGLFAYGLIVVPQQHYSALAAGAAVALIMLPTILRTTEEMLKLVPRPLREGSLALGAPDWKTSVQVLLPAAAGGAATGVILAIARGLGETAPLLFTALGNDRYNLAQIVSSSLQGRLPADALVQRVIGQPVDGLTLTMWKYAQQPFPERVQQAWAVALVLMLFVLGVNVAVRLILARRQRLGR